MSIQVKEKDDISKYVKVSLPLTDENLGYQHHLDISDDEIYYFMGKKVCLGEEAPKNITSKARQEQAKFTKEQMIEYAKTHLMPLVPDDKEFIPRDYWCSFKELLGSNINNESHPVWQLSHRVIKDNYVKHSDTLLLQACGNYKPYIDNAIYQYTLRKYREGYFDLFVSSWELTPIDFSPFFPWRYYDWSHAKETPFMTDCCITHEFRNICDFVEYFNYKRIIIFAPGGNDHFYVELNRRLQNHFEKSKVTVEMVWDDSTIKKFKEEMDGRCTDGQCNWALKVRYNNLRPGRERLEDLIGYDPNRKVDPKDWNYGIKDIDLIKYLRGNKEESWKDEVTPKKERKKRCSNMKETYKPADLF